MKTNIVISAVNLREGGGLTILMQCLECLANDTELLSKYNIIALVHSKQHFNIDNIEFIEFPKAKTSWLQRLKCEYIEFKKISKELSPKLWFSLHDITPNVKAEVRAVYCHNPTPFYKLKLSDFRFNYKVVLFSLFYKYLYRINIKKNNYIVVQQEWLKQSFSSMYKLPLEKIITAIPDRNLNNNLINSNIEINCNKPIFFFPTVSRQFKNIETLCQAAKLLHEKLPSEFKVIITINGKEDAYSKWLFSKFKNVPEINFVGRLAFDEVHEMYTKTTCLVFPSRLETWGLPISEFSVYEKPMIIADLPYAHETASGSKLTAFFKPTNAVELANRMEEIISNDLHNFSLCPKVELSSPFTHSWHDLFILLLSSNGK